MLNRLSYLLLQVRNPDDPMRDAEVRSFARVLHCDTEQIRVCDLLESVPSEAQLNAADMVLLGGSGHYSAAGEGEWLEGVLDGLRGICESAKPTFASCWGFQAMARAMGGVVVHDPACAELGTNPLRLTPEGQADPVFAPLGEVFYGQMGHEDYVRQLPPGATPLASTDKVPNQAYRFDGRPIYCTQFHPELNRDDLLERVRIYPEYIERITGMELEHFGELLQETPKAESLLLNLVRHVFGES